MNTSNLGGHVLRSAILTAAVLAIAIVLHAAFGDAILWRPVAVVASAGFVGLLLLEVLGDLFERRSTEP